jgi:hypothetical protein
LVGSIAHLSDSMPCTRTIGKFLETVKVEQSARNKIKLYLYKVEVCNIKSFMIGNNFY